MLSEWRGPVQKIRPHNIESICLFGLPEPALVRRLRAGHRAARPVNPPSRRDSIDAREMLDTHGETDAFLAKLLIKPLHAFPASTKRARSRARSRVRGCTSGGDRFEFRFPPGRRLEREGKRDAGNDLDPTCG